VRAVSLLLIAIALAACDAKRGSPASAAPVPAADCPECSGLGRCPRCGEEPGGGDVSGRCLLCPHSTGFCRDCGGSGSFANGRTCVLCRGGGICPECGGSGLEPFCGGTGFCASCAGHGTADARSGTPPVRLRLAGGDVLDGRVVGKPGLTIEIEVDGGRRYVPARDFEPASFLRALRVTIDDEDPGDLERLAQFGIRAGGEVLFFARALIAASRISDDERLARSRRDLDLKAESVLAREAADAKEPARRRVLFLLLAHAFPGSPGADGYRAAAGRVREITAAAERDLPESVRARKTAAVEARADRVLSRAQAAREEAEAALAFPDADVPRLLLAGAAARRSAVLSAAAAAGAPDADLSPFRSAYELARGVEARALLRLARRLEAAGRTKRARDLADLAAAIGFQEITEDR